MNQIPFYVTHLSAEVSEGVPIEWQETTLQSGPLRIELDDDGDSHGVLDYDRREAEVEFHVRVSFPELTGTLQSMGVAPEWTQPVRAVLRSRGTILDDHSFALSGASELRPHAMFPAEETAACVLPGT
ncbi:MAG TPA: hypothetical protein VG323_13310 [Thermoanaerobaculia bacterium]|nr:hypothetical protein [Thermoanaerobaculia bacterium]